MVTDAGIYAWLKAPRNVRIKLDLLHDELVATALRVDELKRSNVIFPNLTSESMNVAIDRLKFQGADEASEEERIALLGVELGMTDEAMETWNQRIGEFHRQDREEELSETDIFEIAAEVGLMIGLAAVQAMPSTSGAGADN